MDPQAHPFFYLICKFLQILSVILLSRDACEFLDFRIPSAPKKQAYLLGLKITLVIILAGIIFGKFIPDLALLAGVFAMLIYKLKQQRNQILYLKQLSSKLPHFLDLIAISLQAGLSLPAALQKIAKLHSLGPLAKEFHEVLQQMQAGRDLPSALRQLQKKFALPDLQMSIEVMLMSYTSGGSLSVTISQLAERFYETRFTLAESQANRLPLKLLAPLFICILPSTLVVLFYPLIQSLKGV
jgi:tight adherence protein C